MGENKGSERSVQKIIGKFRAVESAKDEVEAFTKREEKDDGNFMMLYKKSGDDVKDKRRLVEACKELEETCHANEDFNRLVLANIMTYCHDTTKINSLEVKLESIKEHSSKRGLNMISTNITIDQIKNQ